MKLHSTNSIQATLKSSKATEVYRQSINQHLGLAVWVNENDHVSYHNAKHHTLSLYVDGGYSTRRVDKKHVGTGAPNKLCILPSEHQSEWEVGSRQRFEHFYFSDALLRRTALESFDMDPRHVELFDITFFEDERLLNNCHDLFMQSRIEPEDTLRLQEQALFIMVDLLRRYSCSPKNKTNYRSGLRPTALNRVIEYIHENLDQKVTIDSLATVAGISPFHFIRMFKISTGETPHQRIMDIRISEATHLLKQGETQLETALSCGFVDQSHFSRTFKKHYGVTPKQFLQSSR
ncbi:Transcriptional regulator, AraC family [gamma proteobacterium IMCC1989]|nr:Transcriptional regulator, AraC family [gamma proteobacterium IMCC1989]